MRQELEKITGYRGSEKTYEDYFAKVDMLGKFNLKTVLQILVILCKKIDELNTVQSDK